MNLSYKTMLIIDDDKILGYTLKEHFESKSLKVCIVNTGKEAIEICSNEKIDVVLLDEKLPDTKGHTLCSKILSYNELTKIIFVTSFPGFDHALKAIKLGAYDYLPKPFELEELDLAVNNSLRTVTLEKIEQCEKYRDQKDYDSTMLVGSSLSCKKIKEFIELAANSDAPIFITGETGTGKSIIAKAIHYHGNDSNSAFININCASLPPNLIESELFGYEKGAFTGANSMRKGVFEMADGGTLFLDEIGELPTSLQAKLLSTLEDRRVRRIGGDKFHPVDVRIIAATNVNISNRIKVKEFRKDLYYRLSVLRLHIQPLRERKEDIKELCDHFIKILSNKEDIKLSESEEAALHTYSWPGNIRELKNILERALILHHPQNLKPSELINETSLYINSDQIIKESLKTLKEVENSHIRKALILHNNNYTHSAKALGISLSTLKRKIPQLIN